MITFAVNTGLIFLIKEKTCTSARKRLTYSDSSLSPFCDLQLATPAATGHSLGQSIPMQDMPRQSPQHSPSAHNRNTSHALVSAHLAVFSCFLFCIHVCI